MSSVRVLVGTRKGAFILTSDGKREKWDVSGPHFAGWEMYHLKGSPVDPNRIYASQSSGWFGQMIQRSNDGGKTWETVGNKFAYDGVPGTHQWYDGTPHPWEFKRVWHLEPSLTDPDTVYAGVEDAALFRTTDGGQNWNELPGLRGHGSGPHWQPGAGGMCLHTIILDPSNPERMFIAISAAGAFRTDDGGETLEADQQGTALAVHSRSHSRSRPLRASHRHESVAAGCALHAEALGRDAQRQRRRSVAEISGNLPTDFGFVIDVHSHEPETIYVVPIKSDSEHFVHDGKLRVYRSRSGGNEWEPLTKGLPQENCYVNVLRDAMAVDKLDSCGVYFGTTGGQVYASNDAGDSWTPIVRDLPAVLSVESADAAMIRVVLPQHLRTLARVSGEVQLDVEEPVTQRSVLDALEARYPMLQGTIRDHVTQQRRAFLRFFACEEDLSHESPDAPLPEAVTSGKEPFLVIGAIAGG